MIKHFIVIKYQEATPQSHVEEFCTRMLALKSVIPEIGELEIGQDILHDDRSWDILLLMKFETIEALRRYQSHPDHQAVMAFNGPYVTDVASLDYEAPFTPTKGI